MNPGIKCGKMQYHRKNINKSQHPSAGGNLSSTMVQGEVFQVQWLTFTPYNTNTHKKSPENSILQKKKKNKKCHS